MACLRYITIVMVATMALFFTVVAFDNLTDFQSNWLFVQHVLSMDTIPAESVLKWRAITNPALQLAVYYSLIACQIVTACCCWLGCGMMLKYRNHTATRFNQAKKYAFIGLFLGFLLYMVGFIIIGGEWFSMWQSSQWNGQMKAGLFINLIFFILLFLKTSDDSPYCSKTL